MEEDEEERREAMHKFYHAYRNLQRKYDLRICTKFDVYGNNFIEIWEFGNRAKGGRVCQVREESETACFRKAAEELKHYDGKETEKNGRKAC